MENVNYKCTVVKIDNLYDLDNLQNLKGTKIFFSQVLVSKDTKIGDVGIFFPIESQLGENFCKINNLIRSKDENGKPIGGMFDKNRRVRCQKFKGNESMGFWIPISSLSYLTDKYPNIGDEFHELLGENICNKYVPKSNKSSSEPKEKRSRNPKISRLVENQFRLHNDTENLRKNIHKLELEDYISIHYKKHGTSWVVGNILVNKQLKWYEKLAKKLGLNIVDKEYDYVYSSRKIVKNEFETKDNLGYYGEDLWADIKEEIKDKIPKGFTLYGEAVGFTKEGKAIQKDYDYGCKPFEMKIYVYKISVVNQDGFTIYLDDKQISEFCEKYGLNYKSTFIYYGTVDSLYRKLSENHIFPLADTWRGDLIGMLESKYNEKDCYLCVNKVPEEGIVVRKNSLFSYEAYKLKSFRFLQKETEELDKGELNIEDNVEV